MRTSFRWLALSVALCVVACGTDSDCPPPQLVHFQGVLDPHPIKRFPGLIGSPNPYEAVPEGATDIDQETVRRSANVPEPRRGYKASASCSAPINAIAFKQSQVIALTYDTPSNAGTLRLYNPATNAWSTLPMNPGGLPFDRPGSRTGTNTTFVSAQKALYFQSRYGLVKVEDIASGVSRAAVHPKNWTDQVTGVPLAGSYFAQDSTPGWLANGSQVAYRITLARKGANNELIETEPSDRVIFSNTFGASYNVRPGLFVSWMIDPDMFFRLWRSKSVPNGTDPSDEMFLVFESIFGSGTDANGYRSITSGTVQEDRTPDTSLYIPLYTNPQSGIGIAQANAPAPLSSDMAWFKNRMHHLNTQDVQRITVKLIGTGTNGIVDGDSVTVAGRKFYFRTLPNLSSGTTDIQLYTAGTVAQNIENTARYVVKIINLSFQRDATTTPPQSKVFATYISGTSVDAGQILMQSIVPGAQAFTFLASSASGWGADYTAGTTSDPNTQAAGWMWSAQGQPEAVPTANNNPIGDPTAAGQRLIALKDTLFAFKQDGLWAITDDGSVVGPSVRLVDPTIHLIAPATAVAIDNVIFALCDQGVVAISETGGVANISHLQIERELFKLMAYVGPTALANLAFGVAYLPEHTYILSLPESPNATSCTKQYVFNLQSQAWTSWAVPGGVLCGAVHPDTGQLYFGRSDGTLAIERKNFDVTDYQDPGFTIASPTAALTKTLVFSGDLRAGSTPFAVGDIVQQFQAVKALQQRVVGVSYSSSLNQTTVTLDAVPRYAWNQVALLTIVKAIPAVTRFLPFHVDQPLTDKDWGDCYLSFRYCDLDFLSVGFTSEKIPLTDTAVERINNADGSSAPITLDPWGSGAWGSKQWGRQARDLVLKCTVPHDFSYSSQLTLTLSMPCALSHFELSAIDVKLAGTTDRVVR